MSEDQAPDPATPLTESELEQLLRCWNGTDVEYPERDGTIHALFDGNKELRWQNKCDLVDLASGEIIKDVNALSLPMKAGETRWFRKQ